MIAVILSAAGFASWAPAALVVDSDVVTRVTMIAVDSERSNEGTWATRPSPMVSRV